MTWTPEQEALREANLQTGYDAFGAALGSLTTESDVESGWKALFYNKVGWEQTWVNSHVAYLEGLSTDMGAYAASYAGAGPVTLQHVNRAFKQIQADAYHANGDSPTRIC